MLLVKNPSMRLKLKTLLKNDSLWTFQEDVNVKVERLEKELTAQKVMIQELQEQNQQYQVQYQKDQEIVKKDQLQYQKDQDEIKNLRDQIKKLQDEIEQLKHGGSPNLPQQIILSPLVQEGMKLIRSKLWDQEGYKKAFPLFKKAADENKDVEACWRVAACYASGLGIGQNKEEALKYTKIAFDANSIDGIYWFGICQESHEMRFKFCKLASERNHIGAKLMVGFDKFLGISTEKNPAKGYPLLKEAFQQEDGFVTFYHAICVRDGAFGFEKNEKKSNELFLKAKSQPISDSLIFVVDTSELSELKSTW
jgi:tetratricopeptide (TPR) repeat protein